MKLSFRYFALVVMGALISGCAEEVEDAQPSVGGTVTMKTTVSLSENASTRALTEAGVKTFTAGDQIAVVYEQASGTATAVSVGLAADDITESGKKAAFTVTLSSPKAGGKVRYIYPASMVADDVSATAPGNDATIKWSNLNTQNGTFDKIASNLDLATFDGSMTVQGNLPSTATLENQLTIGKFTIKNTSDADITSAITKLTIGDGTNTYTVNPSTLSTIYVAMKPIAGTQTVTVNATDGTNNYTKSVTGNDLAASNIYDITVKVIRKITYLKYTSATDSSYVDVLTTNATIWTGEVTSGNLTAGTYIVEGTATCDGKLTLLGEVNLILTNGSKLTVDDGISTGSDYASLNIYGQGISSSMGQLIVNNNSTIDQTAIRVNGLTIHGGKVVANATQKYGNGIYNIGIFTLYNGVLDASSNDAGIGLYSNPTIANPINIYNGTVTARGSNATSSYDGGCGICNENGSIIIKDAVVKAYGGAGTSARNGAEGILSKLDIEISGKSNVYAVSGKNYSAIYSNSGHITISGGNVEADAVDNASPLLAKENLTITTGIISVKLTTNTSIYKASNWMYSVIGNVILGSKSYTDAQWGSTTITDNTTYPDYDSSGLDIARSGKVLTFTKHE